MFCPDRCTVPFPNVSPRDLTGKNPWRKLDARAESPERMATLARSCLSGGHLYATAAAASPRFAARTNEERTVKVSKALRILGFHFEQTFHSSHASIPASVRPSVRQSAIPMHIQEASIPYSASSLILLSPSSFFSPARAPDWASFACLAHQGALLCVARDIGRVRERRLR